MDSLGIAAEDNHLQVDLDSQVVCLTLDLENDWYFDRDGFDHLTFEYIDEYIELVNRFELPVSIFAVGKTLEKYPEEVEKLRTKLDSEFHLHSYSHDLSKSYDFVDEVSRGITAYEDFFGDRPAGYRAPQGNLDPEELRHLENLGFEFDSSVFPSYRPGLYNNLDAPLRPFRPDLVENLIEYPIGALPWLRVPFSQSYLKLIGRPYLWALKQIPLPDIMVFDSHLQDFFRTASHSQLETPIRQIHRRNLDNSIALFSRLIDLLRERGYEFTSLSNVHDNVDKR